MRTTVPCLLALLPAFFITLFSQAPSREAAMPEWKKHLLEVTDEFDWSGSVEDLAGTWPEDQMIKTLDQIAKEKAEIPGAALLGQLLIRRWAADSPAEAARWVARLPDDSFSRMASGEVVVPWAERDLAEAADWVRRLPTGGKKTAALLSLGYEATMRKEPAIAVTLAADVPPGPEQDKLLNYAVRQWATIDRESSVTWAKLMPDEAPREKLLGQIAIDWGVQNPAEAASFVVTAMASGRARDQAIVKVVRFWASSAPIQSATWVDQFPEGPLRNAAMENLIDVWAKDDPSGAGAWIIQLPADRSRDIALTVYVSLLASSSPNDAARWADAIQDDQRRAQAKADLRNYADRAPGAQSVR
ncbi:MAG TPA: hypothetical protein VJ302_11315 [Blastocatellia bacterium]|nr:hypothetical protein [Blastocatellia bacterium]